MQSGSVSTPFGRRPMTLALVKGQLQNRDAPADVSIDKWRVYRDICECRERLGVTDRSLAILNALLSFHPEQELMGGHPLVVFPSNVQLSLRANGMSGATLRRHLAILVETGLIIRNDSPNGKRYARRDKAGALETAFGFDLSPLVSRHAEFAAIAEDVSAKRKVLRLARERLTLLRRDVRKLISAAIEEGAAGHWAVIEAQFLTLVARLPRHPLLATVTDIAEKMSILREDIINLLESQLIVENPSANDAQIERHLQNSHPESKSELEPGFETKQAAQTETKPQRRHEPLKAFPLSMVLTACPDIVDYGPSGTIRSWRDLMAAAVVVRSMLTISPSAYRDACDVMGPENAAAVVACILERAGHIQSAGGYLRDLTRRAERGEFSLGPMLMALMHSRPVTAKTG
ncbi:replication initiation protein RepC [Neorhizobium sp. P12A]|uniref:plasmid replication protein RepC n=1 Tax=Neorhizobium sp. P12A TaxID=2268027 RepID=UPI0011EF9635|nr:plasmid replication protein RepC [Neorhizobium sp. P12A]KAA0693709.1 replication initiation protein RepC [Neorhizobium sp. P12A]